MSASGRLGATLTAVLLVVAACESDPVVTASGGGPDASVDASPSDDDAAAYRVPGRGGSSASGGRGGEGQGGDGGASAEAGGRAGGSTRDAATDGSPVGTGHAEAGVEGGTDAGRVSCDPVRALTVPSDPCTALAEAECTRLDLCQPFGLRYSYGDAATCRALVVRRCTEEFALPGGAPALLDGLHECAAALINAPCGCVRDEVCQGLGQARGTRENGAACRSNRQCRSGLCDQASAGACGGCAPGGAVGDPCGSSPPACEFGLVCGTSSACVAPAGRGAFCLDGSECMEGLRCIDLRCSVPLALGAGCDGSPAGCDAVAGQSCIAGTCQQLAVVARGEPCGFVAETGGFVSCDAFSRCIDSHCASKTGTGGPCDPTSSASGSPCEPLLVCDPVLRKCSSPSSPDCRAGDGGSAGP